MGVRQLAVVLKHGGLIVQHAQEQAVFGVIPKRQVGQKVDHGGDDHEKAHTEQDGPPGVRQETLHHMLVGDAAATLQGLLPCIQILLVPAKEHGEEEHGKSCTSIDAGPFGCYAKAHTYPAGSKGKESPGQGAVVEA